MIAFGRFVVVEHMVFNAPLHVLLSGFQVHLTTGIQGGVQTKATTVKALLSLDFQTVWRFLPGLQENGFDWLL